MTPKRPSSARNLRHTVKRFRTAIFAFMTVGVLSYGIYVVFAADQFFAGDGSALTASKWASTSAGPFTSAFTSGNVANFATVNGTGTGGSIIVGGLNATENFTLTSVTGTISNLSNGVVPITVSSGKTLDFSTQSFTSSSTAGYTFTGPGVLAMAGNTYGGGFTINSGTLVARGINAMGGSASNVLTINGGTIAGNTARDFTGKFGGGITVGGDFQLGAPASSVSISSDTANLTFSNNMGLGAATRTITIGANGTYTLGGIISGNSGVGLTVNNLSGATGKLALTGANSYTGDTTINGGTLALSGSGSIANSPNIAIAGGAAFDVTGLTTALTLASNQGLKATGTATTGTITVSSTKGLTTASNSPLQFTAFDGTHAPLTVNGATAGSLTLAGGNPVTVTTTTQLGAGDYTLIAEGGSATVVGTAPTSVTVSGSGLAANTAASLQITGGQLILHVVTLPPTINVSTPSLSSFGSVAVGGTSAEQTYTVSGSSLTDDITVAAPSTDFQVSKTSGSGFGPSVTFTQSGGSVPTSTVYVRFSPQSAGAKGGNVTNASAGATTQNVAVSGTGFLPFSGTKTICASGCDYANLTGASGLFAAINATTVGGDITAVVSGDLTEDGTNALDQWAESGAGGYTLTIEPDGTTMRTVSGNVSAGMIRLDGADRVTIDGRFNGSSRYLLFRNTSTGGPTISLSNDASNNTVSYSVIEGAAIDPNPNAPTVGVVAVGAGAATGNDGDTISNNQIRDLSTVPGVPTFLVLSAGASPSVANSNGNVSDNEVFNFRNRGIYVAGINAGSSESWQVARNTVYQTASRTGSLLGVSVSAAGSNTISGNTIHDLTTSGPILRGINLVPTGSGTNTVSGNRIYTLTNTSDNTETTGVGTFAGGTTTVNLVNNQISAVPSGTTSGTRDQSVFGFYDQGAAGTTVNVFYNSVLVGGTASGATATWACQRNDGASSAATWRDNICYNARTGGGANHFAAGDESTSGSFSSDYNIFVGTGAAASDFFDYGTDAAGTPVSFAAWQSSTGGDSHSQAANPGGNYTLGNVFTSGADLHLNTSGTNPATNAGTPVASVTTDFDGDTRDAVFPDIGADEVADAITMQFSSATYSAGEGDGTATITVTRAGSTVGTSTVHYATSPGTATPGSDYEDTSGTLTFDPGDTSKTFNVTIDQDSIYEGPETVALSLSDPTNGSLAAPSSATLTINDDDPAPAATLQFSSSTYSVNEGDGHVTVTVTRTGGASGEVTVKLSTSDGSATAGDDYTAATDQLITFADNDTADKTFDINVADDSLYEGPETFNVTLSGVTGNATLGSPATATVTINDNDKPPTTLTVNTTDDVDNGYCLASHCSLREAINAANADADASTINFQIPSDDPNCDTDSHVCTITPQSDLPAVTERADINGYSQAGASANTQAGGEDAAILIQLDGLGTNPSFTSPVKTARAPSTRRQLRRVAAKRPPNARGPLDAFPSGDGLVLAADHSSVRGLVITRFAGAGVHVSANSCAVAGNFVGTDPSGTLAADSDFLSYGNGLAGVLVDNSGTGNNVGGTSPADRNVVSDSSGDGIILQGVDTTGNNVLGNFVGTDKSGQNSSDENENPFGNLDTGIAIYDARDNQIGSAPAAPDQIGPNVVAASGGPGIEVETFTADASASGNVIQGNFVGTDLTATQNLGNDGDGVTICHDASSSTVGGAGQGNVIANNGGNGVTVTSDSKQANVISQNSIFSNTFLGIDLGGDGVTDNDDQDPDTGPNDYQNFPVIDTATVADIGSSVKGSLNSTPSQTFTIEFFSNDSCDDSNHGEGQSYVGSLTGQASDTNGDLSFTFDPPSPLTAGQFITATATNAASGTSEFSQCVEVTAVAPAGQIVFADTSYTVDESVGDAQIAVTRTGGSSGKITATFSTSDDTATAGDDYTAVTSATVTFDDGETGTKNVIVHVNDDNVYEGDESLNLDLSTTTVSHAVRPSGARRGGVRPKITPVGTHATLTITDNETPPSFSVNDVYVSRPQSGGSTAKFTVMLSGPAQAGVSVHYATADGTAHQPADYTQANGTLSFDPLDTSKTVSVPVNVGSPGSKTFTLNLTNASAPLTISDAAGTATIVDPVSSGQVIISEFRVRGPAGAQDEFVELYNTTANPITVAAEDGSPGWALAAIAADGTTLDPLTTIPAGTTIPPRAHFLVADVPAASPASGYSLNVAPDLTYDGDIDDGTGVALFRTTDLSDLTTAPRLDAAGFSDLSTPAAAYFREGTGLASPGKAVGQYSFVRKMTTGLPQDTDDNAQDFAFVSTDGGVYGGVQSQLGAPGPENLGAPLNRGSKIKSSLLDQTVSTTAPPNRERNPTGVANGTFGTLTLRRTFTNNTGSTVTRLRFRVVDVTTLNSPGYGAGGQADVRLLSAAATTAGGKDIAEMTLEEPPAQSSGGGLNSTIVATLPGTPPNQGLAPTDSINVQFVLGIEQPGSFRFFVVVEALLDTDTASPATTASPLKHGADKPPAPKPSATKSSKGGDVVKIN